jgi:hypothetical protein
MGLSGEGEDADGLTDDGDICDASARSEKHPLTLRIQRQAPGRSACDGNCITGHGVKRRRDLRDQRDRQRTLTGVTKDCAREGTATCREEAWRGDSLGGDSADARIHKAQIIAGDSTVRNTRTPDTAQRDSGSRAGR